MFRESEFERNGKSKKWLNRVYQEILDRSKDFDGRVVALNRGHLENLIDAAMFMNGPKCDLNFIDVSQVKMMFDLFKHSPFDGDISQWDVSNVECMDNMFTDSLFSGNIDAWDVSRVESMYEMFDGSVLEKLGKVPGWYKE